MKRSRNNFGFGPTSLVVTFALAVGLASTAAATKINVTPSLLDLASTAAIVEGRSLMGGSRGDGFSLGYSVENPDAAEITALFTSITYDPNILRFVGGVGFPIFEQTIPGTPFDRTIVLNPILDPTPKVTSPGDTVWALNHVLPPPAPDEDFIPPTAIGPELAFVVTFEILDPDLLTSIDMVFGRGDAALVNGVSYCGSGSTGCDVFSDEIFEFKNFKVGPRGASKGTSPVPEPTVALLMGLGLAGLAGSRVCATREG